MTSILYQSQGDKPSVDEALALYVASGLAERRPCDDRERFAAMLANADVMITARIDAARGRQTSDRRLVGLARSITDGVYCTYLSDLCVDRSIQRQGIGRELVEQTRRATPRATIILLSAPAAVDYYPRIGMERHSAAFTLPPLSEAD